MIFERPPGRRSLGTIRPLLMKLQALTLVVICAIVSKQLCAQAGVPPGGSIITSQAATLDPTTRKAYVVDTQRDCVSAINISTQQVTCIPVGKSPIAMALNPRTHLIYIANHGSGTVSVIDEKTNRVAATIPVDSLPYSIAVDQLTNQIFVSSVYSNSLKIIDGASGSVRTMKAISADAMSLNAEAGRLYLLGYESAELTVFNAADQALSKLPMGQMHLWAIGRNPATSTFYVTRIGSADVLAYNEKLHTSSIIKTGNYPCAIAINTKANRIYVVNYADQSLTVIDGKDNHVLATLSVGNHPQAVAVDEAADKAYVVNVLDDSVTIIDGAKSSVASTISVGKNPYGIVVDPVTGTVVTANQGEPSFTLWDNALLHANMKK
jgi:YVTN family beta-propeller protein